MTRISSWIARALVPALAFALCGPPEMAVAQSTGSAPQASPASPNSSDEIQAPSADRGIVNPSQGPLEPVSPGEAPPPSAQDAPEAKTPPRPKNQRPLGAAVGQEGQTIGGPASKPAGTAIAPAKQHQVRSLFIKIGALAAAGAAIGTVFALSRGTPSNPPGAR